MIEKTYDHTLRLTEDKVLDIDYTHGPGDHVPSLHDEMSVAGDEARDREEVTLPFLHQVG